MAADAVVTFPQVGTDDLIKQIQTYLALAKMRLCKSAVPVGPNVVLADLTAIEADYTGYAAKTLTAWTGPYSGGVGQSSILSAMQVFSPSGTAITNSIYGGWVETAGGVLIFEFVLATPKALLDTESFLALIAEYALPSGSAVHQLD